MAISTTTNTVLLAGNSSTVVFPYSFPFYNQMDLNVYLFDTSAGGITKQVLNSNYSISATADSTGIYPNGGNVIFTSSVINTSIVVIDRQPIETQTFAILQNGFISSVGLTHQLDYLTLLIQDMADRISRSVAVPTGFGLTNSFNPQLPTVVGLQSSAGLYVVINSSATGFTLAGSTSIPTGPLGYVLTGLGNGLPAAFELPNLTIGSGVMGFSQGGTGVGTTPIPYAVPYGNGTGYGYANPGGAGQVLTANASSAPTYQNITINNASGVLAASNGGTGIAVFVPNQIFAGLGTTQMQQFGGTPTWPLVANSGALPSFQQIALGGPAMSGTLALTSGGTGVTTTPAVGAIPYGSGVGYTYLAIGSSGTILQSFGGGVLGWVNSTSGLGYTSNQYGLIVSGSSNTQLNVIAPNSSVSLTIVSQGTGANPKWATIDSISPMTTLGDTLYYGTGATRLPGITSNSSAMFVQTGSGGLSAAPSWRTINFPQTTILTGSTTGTYTTPTGCLYLEVEVVGPGGSGGGCALNAAGNASAASGAGGGGYAKGIFEGSSLLASYSYTVAGGAAATSAANVGGGTGGSTIFGFLSATGGVGGSGGASSAAVAFIGGGAGGIGTNGFLQVTGNAGGFGGVGTAGAANLGGAGGASHLSGNTQNVSGGTAGGIPAVSPGGGGGGGISFSSGAAQAGAAGANGQIVIKAFFQ